MSIELLFYGELIERLCDLEGAERGVAISEILSGVDLGLVGHGGDVAFEEGMVDGTRSQSDEIGCYPPQCHHLTSSSVSKVSRNSPTPKQRVLRKASATRHVTQKRAPFIY